MGVVNQCFFLEIFDRQGGEEPEQMPFRLLAKTGIALDILPGLRQATIRLIEYSFGFRLVDHCVVTQKWYAFPFIYFSVACSSSIPQA